MARIIRPTWAIRCVNSGCRKLFEVAMLEDGKQQEVVCPNCGKQHEVPEKDVPIHVKKYIKKTFVGLGSYVD